jgi:hypothetical protein
MVKHKNLFKRDVFHELILNEEIANCGAAGVASALLLGIQLNVQPIINFGTKQLKDRIIKDILTGEKRKTIFLIFHRNLSGNHRTNHWIRRSKYFNNSKKNR